jgi:predicted peroxiredoxin
VPRYLAVVERAYRGTLEEQCAHILMANLAFTRLGAPTDLLLRGNAVLYAVKDQARPHLDIGAVHVDTLPHFGSSVKTLLDEGVNVYACDAGCERLRLDRDRLIDGVRPVDLEHVARLFAAHDAVWFW